MFVRWTLLVAFLLWKNPAECTENDGVLNKIKSGLQYAKSYLDTAKEIADLVSKSLGHKNTNERRGDEEGKRDKNPKDPTIPKLISGFFRLLGLDSPKITAIAVNSVIFLAQMISSLFDDKPKLEEPRGRREDPPFDPYRFIVGNKNEKIQDLLTQAKDPSLPDQLIERLDGLDSSCVKLLMCKTSPIIRAAQTSLKNKTGGRRLDITSWLPSKETFEDNADVCEEKYSECDLFPESR